MEIVNDIYVWVLSFYIMGMMIMGNDLVDLVVDCDCWMYDYLNLFIVSMVVYLSLLVVNLMLIGYVLVFRMVKMIGVEV